MSKPELVVASDVVPDTIPACKCCVQSFIPKAGPDNAGLWCEGSNPLSQSPTATVEELVKIIESHLALENSSTGVSTRIVYGSKEKQRIIAYQL